MKCDKTLKIYRNIYYWILYRTPTLHVDKNTVVRSWRETMRYNDLILFWLYSNTLL